MFDRKVVFSELDLLVEAVDGSWSTVVGLPVSRLAQEMLSRGWLTPVGAGPAV